MGNGLLIRHRQSNKSLKLAEHAATASVAEGSFSGHTSVLTRQSYRELSSAAITPNASDDSLDGLIADVLDDQRPPPAAQAYNGVLKSILSSEHELEQFVLFADCAVMVIDQAFKIVQISEYGEKLFGCTQVEVIGAPITSLISRTSQEHLLQILQNLASETVSGTHRFANISGVRYDSAKNATEPTEASAILQDDTKLDLRVAIYQIGATQPSSQAQEQFVLLCREVTNLVSMRAQMESIQQRARIVMRAVMDAVVVVGQDGTIQSVNAATENMFLKTSDELLHTNISTLMDPPTVSRSMSFLAGSSSPAHRIQGQSGLASRVSRSPAPQDGVLPRSWRLVRRDGSVFPAQASITKFVDDNGYDGYLMLLRDLSAAKLAMEAELTERLLQNMLPKSICDRLKKMRRGKEVIPSKKDAQHLIADNIDMCSIMFADMVGFTTFCSHTAPAQVVHILNELFGAFDLLCEELGIEKIKTIGDCYMCAAGLPDPCDDHAHRLIELGFRMLQVMESVNQKLGLTLSIRIGISSGHVIAGVIGSKRFLYDVWGDCVNVASRMESSGQSGRIHVSEATMDLVNDKYEMEQTGSIAIKGKGMMSTAFVIGKKQTTIPS